MQVRAKAKQLVKQASLGRFATAKCRTLSEDAQVASGGAAVAGAGLAGTGVEVGCEDASDVLVKLAPSGKGAPSTLNPQPLSRVPCTLNPAPCTVHRAPCTLHPKPFNPASQILDPTPQTLNS